MAQGQALHLSYPGRETRRQEVGAGEAEDLTAVNMWYYKAQWSLRCVTSSTFWALGVEWYGKEWNRSHSYLLPCFSCLQEKEVIIGKIWWVSRLHSRTLKKERWGEESHTDGWPQVKLGTIVDSFRDGSEIKATLVNISSPLFTLIRSALYLLFAFGCNLHAFILS